MASLGSWIRGATFYDASVSTQNARGREGTAHGPYVSQDICQLGSSVPRADYIAEKTPSEQGRCGGVRLPAKEDRHSCRSADPSPDRAFAARLRRDQLWSQSPELAYVRSSSATQAAITAPPSPVPSARAMPPVAQEQAKSGKAQPFYIKRDGQPAGEPPPLSASGHLYGSPRKALLADVKRTTATDAGSERSYRRDDEPIHWEGRDDIDFDFDLDPTF